ncbi:hypothetical protein [Planctomicrobium sp. SH527]|uniref:hypothetical protein n=1 Tax=Planctomicrobium sp. SH527 TaxID=3448123 RepID=UPI003F5BCC48
MLRFIVSHLSFLQSLSVIVLAVSCLYTINYVAFATDDELAAPLAVFDETSNRNREKVADCHLEWTIKEKGCLPISGLSEKFLANVNPGTTSKYVSDRNGMRYALKATEQKVTLDGSVDETITRSVFDGNEFRSVTFKETPKLGIALEPDFQRDQDWLEIIGWNHPSLLAEVRAGKASQMSLTHSWKVDTSKKPEERVLELVLTNNSDGGKLVVVYNIDRGACKQDERWIDSKGRTYYHEELEIREVTPGFWLPINFHSCSIEPQTGKIAFEKHAELDLDECRFGNDYQPEASLFEIPVEDNMNVVDLRAGVRVTYNGRDAPMSLNELKERLAQQDESIVKTVPIEDSGLRRWSTFAKWLFVVNGVALIVIGIVVAAYRRLRRA